MNYLFTIIVPVHNCEKFLKRAINSIINQKKKDIQIVIINDKSNQKTKKICNLYKKKFKFIKLINNNINKGVGASRNIAIRESEGKFLIFLDSDDQLQETALTSLELLLKKDDVSDFVIVRNKKSTYPTNNLKLIDHSYNNNKNSNNLIKHLHKTNFPFSDCWLVVVRNSFIKKNNILFSNSRFGESELFMFKLVILMKKFTTLSKIFYIKNDRSNSLNQSNDIKTLESVLKNLIDLTSYIGKIKLDKNKKNFAMKYVQNIFGTLTTLLILMDNTEIKKINLARVNIKSIRKKPENLSLNVNLSNKEIHKELIKFKNKVIQKRFYLLRNKLINKNIYLYCRSKYALATLQILRQNNFKVKNIIDDNSTYRKDQYFNLTVISLNNFLKKVANNKKKTHVIINHQNKTVIQSITKVLEKNKIPKLQISAIKY